MVKVGERFPDASAAAARILRLRPVSIRHRSRLHGFPRSASSATDSPAGVRESVRQASVPASIHAAGTGVDGFSRELRRTRRDPSGETARKAASRTKETRHARSVRRKLPLRCHRLDVPHRNRTIPVAGSVLPMLVLPAPCDPLLHRSGRGGGVFDCRPGCTAPLPVRIADRRIPHVQTLRGVHRRVRRRSRRRLRDTEPQCAADAGRRRPGVDADRLRCGGPRGTHSAPRGSMDAGDERALRILGPHISPIRESVTKEGTFTPRTLSLYPICRLSITDENYCVSSRGFTPRHGRCVGADPQTARPPRRGRAAAIPPVDCGRQA